MGGWGFSLPVKGWDGLELRLLPVHPPGSGKYLSIVQLTVLGFCLL